MKIKIIHFFIIFIISNIHISCQDKNKENKKDKTEKDEGEYTQKELKQGYAKMSEIKELMMNKAFGEAEIVIDEMLEKWKGKNEKLTLFLTIWLSEIYFHQGRYKEHTILAEKVLGFVEDSNQLAILVAIWGNVGVSYAMIGQYEKGKEYLNKTLKSIEEHSVTESQKAYTKNSTLLALAYIEYRKRNYKEAEKWLEKSREYVKELKFENYEKSIASTDLQFAKVAFAQKEYQKAEDLLTKSITLFREYGNNEIDIANCELGFAALLHHKKKYQKTIEMLEKNVEVYKQNNLKTGSNYITSLLLLASSYQELDKLDNKELIIQLLREAHKLTSQSYGKSHPKTKSLNEILEDNNINIHKSWRKYWEL